MTSDINIKFVVCKRVRTAQSGFPLELRYYLTTDNGWFEIVDKYHYPKAMVFADKESAIRKQDELSQAEIKTNITYFVEQRRYWI